MKLKLVGTDVERKKAMNNFSVTDCSIKFRKCLLLFIAKEFNIDISTVNNL